MRRVRHGKDSTGDGEGRERGVGGKEEERYVTLDGL